MAVPDEFHTLLATEMDRRAFLAYCGAALLAVLGVSGLLKAILHPTHRVPSHASTISSPSSYGGGVYGGHR